MKRLIQLLPTHHRNDAVGAEALVIERLLCAEGWRLSLIHISEPTRPY